MARLIRNIDRSSLPGTGARRRARAYSRKDVNSRKEAKLISGTYAIAGSEEGGPSVDIQTHPHRKFATPA